METLGRTKNSTYQEHLFNLCDRFDKDLANYQSLSLPDDDAEKSDILQVLGYDVDTIVRSISVATDWVEAAVTRYVAEKNIIIKKRILEDCCFVLGSILRSFSGTEHTLGIGCLISKLRNASVEDTHLITLWHRLESVGEEYGRIAMDSYRTLYNQLRG